MEHTEIEINLYKALYEGSRILILSRGEMVIGVGAHKQNPSEVRSSGQYLRKLCAFIAYLRLKISLELNDLCKSGAESSRKLFEFRHYK